MLTTVNTRGEATQTVMAAKLTRQTYKLAIQLHIVTGSCMQFSLQAASPKTFGYTIVYKGMPDKFIHGLCIYFYIAKALIFLQTFL
jgi:hypothetical protein